MTELGRVLRLACHWCHRPLRTVVLPPPATGESYEAPTVRVICHACFLVHRDKFQEEARE